MAWTKLIQWEKYSWKRLSLIGDETVINLQSTKDYVFSDSMLCLGRILQHPESNEAWKNRVAGVRSEKSYRDYDAINGESTEFECNIFPGFTTLQLCDKINDVLSDLGQTPETFTGRILFMSMFNDISCDRKDNKDECLANAESVKVFARRFGIGQMSFIVLGEVKAEDPLQNENPMNDQIIWQQYIQQVESLSPENKVSKFCKEAGFMRVVEVEQDFVTKDTGSLRQFRSVACREYTLPRDDPASQPKGWIQGNM